jgi:cell division protease FtsH
MARKVAFCLAIALAAIILLLLYNLFGGIGSEIQRELSYSRLVQEVEQGRVTRVAITGDQLVGHLSDGGEFRSGLPPQQQSFIDTLMQHGVEIDFTTQEPRGWVELVLYCLPTFLYIGVLVYYLHRIVRALRAGADKLDALQNRIAQFAQGDRKT